MTKKEFEALLEEAFLEGYNDTMKEIFNEDSSFDLEEEMGSYNEELSRQSKIDIRKANNSYKKVMGDNLPSDRIRGMVARKSWEDTVKRLGAHQIVTNAISNDRIPDSVKNKIKNERDKEENKMYNTMVRMDRADTKYNKR